MPRRPDGALENDIMRVLWEAPHPLQPGEVNDALDHQLAYTTVATVLGRLVAKGLVERTLAGRGYVYAAAMSEAAFASRRIAEVLDQLPDRSAALAWFVGGLSAKDARSLRVLLDGIEER